MREQQTSSAATAPSEFTGFELAESCALYEVFESLTEQLIAFSNQPRFGDAGLGLLEDISEDFAKRSRLLAAHIKATRPADRTERGLRAKVILRDAMLDTDDLSEIAAIAAVLAAPERH
ncbi:hypothetical protein FHT98_0619 [Bosea sp. AK1]|uniref:hypothetical protein n=1 Tax=Bosea sp. AK1 TaxID=2587160 RepID=UPI00114FCF25|nr:hypothetical protein [Bosea sp. AK1]TQI72899.1 hypothetical protein FHT98_0619 [Bosea sp. AK1]